jgi:hypothetical protein
MELILKNGLGEAQRVTADVARNYRELKKKAAAELEAEMNTADDEGPGAHSGE